MINRHSRKAAFEHRQYVTHGGAGGRCHDADASGQRGQRFFPLVREQSFRGKFLLERFELSPQLTFAGLLELLHDHLVLAARFVNADAAECEYLIAVAEADRRAALALPEPGAAQLGGFILQREINVSRRRACQVRYLAFHPEACQTLLEQRFRTAIQFCDSNCQRCGAFIKEVGHPRSITAGDFRYRRLPANR